VFYNWYQRSVQLLPKKKKGSASDIGFSLEHLVVLFYADVDPHMKLNNGP
jgi:hypothetical protein